MCIEKYIRGIRAPLRSLSLFVCFWRCFTKSKVKPTDALRHASPWVILKSPLLARTLPLPRMRVLCGTLLMHGQLLSTTVQRPLDWFSCAPCSTLLLLLLLLLQMHLDHLRSNICLGRVRPNFVLLAVSPSEFPHLLVILNQVRSAGCSESWISEQTTPHGKHMSTPCVANSVEQPFCLTGSDDSTKLITTTSH